MKMSLILVNTLLVVCSTFVQNIFGSETNSLKVVELRPKAILSVTEQSGTHGALKRCEFTVDSRSGLALGWEQTIVGLIIHSDNDQPISENNPIYLYGIIPIHPLPIPRGWANSNRQPDDDQSWQEESYDGVLRIVSKYGPWKNVWEVSVDPDLQTVQGISFVQYEKAEGTNQMVEKVRVSCSPLTM